MILWNVLLIGQRTRRSFVKEAWCSVYSSRLGLSSVECVELSKWEMKSLSCDRMRTLSRD